MKLPGLTAGQFCFEFYTNFQYDLHRRRRYGVKRHNKNTFNCFY